MVFSVLPETQAIYGLLIAILILYFTGLLSGTIKEIPLSIGVACVGAGLSIGIAGLSGIGQGIAAGSGVASVTEKDEMFGKGMVFSVLPETQAIYGLLIAILILYFTGVLSGEFDLSYTTGVAIVGTGFAAGIAGLSAIGQGITAGGSITATSKASEAFSKGMIFSVMSETFAIFGLLIAILILYGLNLFG
jgi:V/A-type H+-transporting ATPase subunit K